MKLIIKSAFQFTLSSVKITHGHDGRCRLIIEKVDPGDSGCYKLVLSNKTGEVSTQSSIAVTRKLCH